MIRINKARCKLCGLCISFCPQKGLEARGREIIIKEGSKCTKCKLCEKYCPELAIEVE